MTEPRQRPARRVHTAANTPVITEPKKRGRKPDTEEETAKKRYPHTGERARTRLLKALANVQAQVTGDDGKRINVTMNEDRYLEEVVRQSLTDPKIMMAVFGRLSPQAKSLAPTVAIKFPKNGSPVEKMEAVLHAVTDGDISPDVGITITAMIKQTVDVNEVTELMDRMAKLEESIRAQALEKNEGKANG